MNLSLWQIQIAAALGGEISNGQVLAPGPGHSTNDRSLSVKLSSTAQDGFVVHSFAGDDPIACRDYVRRCLGLSAFKPNGGGKAKRLRTIIYDFCDPATGDMRYQKERIEFEDGSKTFFFKPKGRGGSDPLLYGGERLADITTVQPVYIVEGEKKVDRLRELDAVAVSGDTGDSSKWLPSHAVLLRGLPIILWPDSDAVGEKYIERAARAVLGASPSADIRVVRPFGSPNGAKGRDVCDWEGSAEDLARLAASAEAYALASKSVNQDTAPSDRRGTAPPKFSRVINPADWEGVPIPERKWIVLDYIPAGVVAMLSGHGGQGKRCSWP